MDKKVKKVMKVQKKSEKTADNVQVKKKPDGTTALEKVEKVQEKTKNKPQNNGKPDKGHGKAQANVEKRTQGKVPEKPQNKKTAQMKGKPQGKQEKGKETDEKAIAKRGRPALVTMDTAAYADLVAECSKLLENTEQNAIMNYWKIGRLVNRLRSETKKYGSKTVFHLSKDLGKDTTTLNRAGKFAQIYKESELVPHGTNLTWGHIKVLMAVSDEKEREKLRENVEKDGWTIRELSEKVYGNAPKMLPAPSIEGFLTKATKLTDYLNDDVLNAIKPEEVGKEQMEELEVLYQRIGQILERVRQGKPT